MFQKLSQKLSQAYQAIKQRIIQTRTNFQTWLKAHRRAILVVGTALGLGVTGLIGLLLWRRSPAFRAAVMSLVAFAVTSLALKSTPVEAPTLTPVEPSPDGRESELVF